MISCVKFQRNFEARIDLIIFIIFFDEIVVVGVGVEVAVRVGVEVEVALAVVVVLRLGVREGVLSEPR